MDKITAIRTFVRVVQSHSFSAVARELGSSQGTVSKRVAALEEMLGIRLLSRSSRELLLTPAGEEYYRHALAMLEELDELESRLKGDISRPRGMLRVAAPVAIGRILLAPVVKEFLDTYPDIQLSLSLSDAHVDLLSDGIDVAIRASQLEDSSLVARPLLANPMVAVASPCYLQQAGVPEHPSDLTAHACISYSRFRSSHLWQFHQGEELVSVQVGGRLQCDNGDTLLELALADNGIALLPEWMLTAALQSGQLVRVLSAYQARELPINAVYLNRRYVPLKVKCFIDFVKQRLEM
ncbi:LysR substrate-binding domain-containing protein [Shewanella corallii]|uniref:LysR substrate-binding domain-containing protein n=1 Tax=Shewanella corallii TaxID=560080 RepID=A0ABT0N699_9GAMM|nr:LysR family transcriptional regulator [Shewanella corallii]MCL2913905.1 LysR substrate-binding domain-containing protein [Shewanella corallii]